jgi:PKD repeat protein
MRNDLGVSTVVATVFLISIFVVAAAIVMALVVNQAPTEPVPEVRMSVTTSGGEILVYHEGGESLERNELRIIVDGVDETSHFNFTNNDDNWPWSIGETLTYTGASITPDVQIIYTGGSRTDLIYSTSLNATTPAPTGSGAPVAAFTASPTGGIAPLAVQFTDTSNQYPTSWSWSFGDSGTSDLQNPVHIFTSPDTMPYTVSLTVSNAHGSASVIKTHYIDVKYPVVANFTANTTAGGAPLTVQFTDTSTGAPTSREWDFGDGQYATSQNPSHTYTSAGTYTVKLTASHAYSSDSKEEIDFITVVDPVTADFTASPTDGIAPLTVQFTDTSTGNPDAWSWDFGDGGISSEQNPEHEYGNPGTYSVSLTATNSTYSSSDTEAKASSISVRSVLFEDDFEASLAAWTLVGNVDLYTGDPKIGAQSVQIKGGSTLQKSLSTGGSGSIRLSYFLGATGLSGSETVKGEWYDGSIWHTLTVIDRDGDDAGLQRYSYDLPSQASDNPDFRIRFTCTGNGNGDYGFVDSVQVTGIPISSP